MVAIYVGVTDGDWFRFLSQRPDITEVNFWQPADTRRFGALIPGELFLFKLKAPDHFIAGGGLFVAANAYPTSLAWAAFGEGNGVASLNELRQRIGRLGRPFRDQPFDPTRDPPIGCRILEQPFFFPREQWIPVPASWSRNLVQGRTYDTASEDGRHLWEAVMERLERTASEPIAQVARFGSPVLIEPRLGQGAFRVTVTDAYGRRCALTGERTLPILDAAHIKAYAEGGAHQVVNGLLLRTDIHRLFDIGYVTVSTDGRFEVGRRLKDDFENGRHYYDLHGQPLCLPRDPTFRPSREALQWHQSNRFLG
jgi:putative restriction endonuclease